MGSHDFIYDPSPEDWWRQDYQLGPWGMLSPQGLLEVMADRAVYGNPRDRRTIWVLPEIQVGGAKFRPAEDFQVPFPTDPTGSPRSPVVPVDPVVPFPPGDPRDPFVPDQESDKKRGVATGGSTETEGGGFLQIWHKGRKISAP